jgi:CRISPR-associated endonuclease/helicase Cas3
MKLKSKSDSKPTYGQREFQRDACANLSERHSVLVVAPTGLGKTRAALGPFLTASDPRLNTRLIYTLPLRALAYGIRSQFLALSNGTQPTVHHGDESESKFFSEGAIITTVDQYFTAFAGAPLSWASHLSHAAAGAVLTSYSVFDEVHLLSPRVGLQMLFAILRLRQRWGLPSSVMTATLPEPVINFLEENCGLRAIRASDKDVQERDSWRKIHLLLDGQQMSENGFKWDEKEPEKIATLVKKKWQDWNDLKVDGPRKIIVFLNTVERAIKVYEKLDKLCPNLCLTHSRFTKEHRRSIEDKIEKFFGKDASIKDEAILITTQVAEAGLNISAPLVVTELCPVDSLIQRAGRCQRFLLEESGKKELNGLVTVVKPRSEDPNKKEWYVPYFDSFAVRPKKEKKNLKQAWIPIAEVSRICLEKHFGSADDSLLDWQKEKKLINDALSVPFETILSNAPNQMEEKDLKKKAWHSLYYEVSKTKRDEKDENDEQEV